MSASFFISDGYMRASVRRTTGSCGTGVHRRTGPCCGPYLSTSLGCSVEGCSAGPPRWVARLVRFAGSLGG
jgi:hypothetical protein